MQNDYWLNAFEAHLYQMVQIYRKTHIIIIIIKIPKILILQDFFGFQ